MTLKVVFLCCGEAPSTSLFMPACIQGISHPPHPAKLPCWVTHSKDKGRGGPRRGSQGSWMWLLSWAACPAMLSSLEGPEFCRIQITGPFGNLGNLNFAPRGRKPNCLIPFSLLSSKCIIDLKPFPQPRYLVHKENWISSIINSPGTVGPARCLIFLPTRDVIVRNRAEAKVILN